MLKTVKTASGDLTEVKNTIRRWNSISLGDEFTVCHVIGSGSFGEVVKVIKKPEGNEYALKIVRFDSNHEEAAKCYREVKALGKLTHSNIVHYYSSWTHIVKIPFSEYEKLKDQNELGSLLSEEMSKFTSKGYCIYSLHDENISSDDGNSITNTDSKDEPCSSSSSNFIHFETETEFKEVQYLCILMELCEKRTLREVIDDNLYLDEETTSKYFKEICEGLDHMHQKDIVHRDLKPDNIFLTKENQIKIGDFGLSKEINDSIIVNDSSVDNNPYRCGTLIYNAPELRHQSFSKKADIYSLGVIYLEMCSKPMTDCEKIKLLIPLINAKLENFLLKSSINPNAKRLIKDLLNEECNKRPNCAEILKKLDLQKTRAKIRNQIQDSKKICIPQQNIFRKILRTIHNSLSNKEFFLETATAIFRLHGGHNISMPIFTPPYLHNEYVNNLTGLINGSGYTVSLANSSRIAFCRYVIVNQLKDIARYSVGKVFVERHFLPLEMIECSFQRISSTPSDYSAPEVFSIIRRVIDDTFEGHQYNLKFIINDGFLLKTLLNNCALDQHQRTEVELFLFNLWEKMPSKDELFKGLTSCNLKAPKIFIILQCSGLFNFESVKDKIEKTCKNSKQIKQSLLRLEKIIEIAIHYGIKSEDIYICPLLITQKYWPNFMFKVIMNDKHLVAFGDRFDNLLNQFNKRTKRSKSFKKLKMHGVDVSFVVDNVVELLEELNVKTQPHLDVLIVSKKETITDAICIHKKLLDSKISSEINNLQTAYNDCRLVIEVLGNFEVIVKSTKSNKTAWKYDWRKPEFITKVLFLARSVTSYYLPSISF